MPEPERLTANRWARMMIYLAGGLALGIALGVATGAYIGVEDIGGRAAYLGGKMMVFALIVWAVREAIRSKSSPR